MSNQNKLRLIKLLHTAIWLGFNAVIAYMLYAVVTNQINGWLWACYAAIGAEGLVLLLFKWYCPLTVWARRYSTSSAANFDIYLPEWLARYNKVIYTTVVVLVTLGLLYRLWQGV